MKPRVASAPLSRTNIDKLLLDLRSVETTSWPVHLRFAAEIIEDSYHRPDIARDIVLDCLRCAHDCVVAIYAAGFLGAQVKARAELHKSSTRLCNCAKRVKARIRNQLDQAAMVFLNSGIDSESFAAFVAAVIDIAASYPEDDDAKRILTALGQHELEDGVVFHPTKFLNDSEALHSLDSDYLHKRLEKLAACSGKFTALMVFACMADATGTGHWEAGSRGDDLIVAYIRDVAALWEQKYDIRPGREYQLEGSGSNNRKYKSRFHRCIELILLDRLNPWSRAFEPSAEDIARTQAIEKQLSREEREALIPLRHSDLISDYQIRQALKLVSKS